jgi:hypothetical protein
MKLASGLARQAAGAIAVFSFLQVAADAAELHAGGHTGDPAAMAAIAQPAPDARMHVRLVGARFFPENELNLVTPERNERATRAGWVTQLMSSVAQQSRDKTLASRADSKMLAVMHWRLRGKLSGRR